MSAEADYEGVPYDLGPYAVTHPERVVLASRLNGGPSVDLAAPFRLLELGCGSGLNLGPLAVEYPQAELVGIDRSTAHVARARRLIDALGVDNLAVHEADIRALPEELGQFDLIVAHGVYSWVSDEVRSALRSVLKRHLAPEGLAVVSYNALPGWHQRRAVREAVLYHVRDISDPRARVQQARALVGFLASSVNTWQTVWHQAVTEEHERLQATEDAVVFHDLLEPHNEPFAYERVVEDFAGVGLVPVGDTAFPDRLEERVPAGILEALRTVTTDPVGLQQAVDLCVNRMFRRTVWSHRPPSDDGHEFLRTGWVRPLDAEPMDGLGSRATELLEAIQADRTPQAVATLCTEEHDLTILSVLIANLQVEWRGAERQVSGVVSERPEAFSVARAVATLDFGRLPNVWHEMVEIDPVVRLVVQWMDGTRTVPELCELLAERAEQGVFQVRDPAGQPVTGRDALLRSLQPAVADALTHLVREGMLVR